MALCFVMSSIVDILLCLHISKRLNTSNNHMRKRLIPLMGIYFEILFMLTLGCRVPGNEFRYVLIPDKITNGFVDFVENIILFIPAGAFIAFLKEKRTWIFALLIGATISFSIELVQFITRLGYFETRDILCNLIGSVIGFFLVKFVARIKRKL
jgi:glycopeptide antibiotics resistance protein